MSTWAKVIADSISPAGSRLTTLELNYPYIIHPEVMTHRVFSRNAASMRAIPTRKIVAQVKENPFIPRRWPIEQSGMQPAGFYSGESVEGKQLEFVWQSGIVGAVQTAEQMMMLGVHKQIATRPLAPYSYIRVIVSATEWENWDNLRRSSEAQDEIHDLADRVWEARQHSEPIKADLDYWHLPYIQPDERAYFKDDVKIKLSVARCARVSYLTHDGKVDVEKDLKLYDRLLSSGHMSPFEHVARPFAPTYMGNFFGWKQWRKHIRGEAVWQPNDQSSSTSTKSDDSTAPSS